MIHRMDRTLPPPREVSSQNENQVNDPFLSKESPALPSDILQPALISPIKSQHPGMDFSPSPSTSTSLGLSSPLLEAPLSSSSNPSFPCSDPSQSSESSISSSTDTLTFPSSETLSFRSSFSDKTSFLMVPLSPVLTVDALVKADSVPTTVIDSAPKAIETSIVDVTSDSGMIVENISTCDTTVIVEIMSTSPVSTDTSPKVDDISTFTTSDQTLPIPSETLASRTCSENDNFILELSSSPPSISSFVSSFATHTTLSESIVPFSLSDSLDLFSPSLSSTTEPNERPRPQRKHSEIDSADKTSYSFRERLTNLPVKELDFENMLPDFEPDVFHVESLIGKKFDRKMKKTLWHVKWEGYSETSWEPEENLMLGAAWLIKDFNKRAKTRNKKF